MYNSHLKKAIFHDYRKTIVIQIALNHVHIVHYLKNVKDEDIKLNYQKYCVFFFTLIIISNLFLEFKA